MSNLHLLYDTGVDSLTHCYNTTVYSTAVVSTLRYSLAKKYVLELKLTFSASGEESNAHLEKLLFATALL